jgi:hypothetical protein
MVGRKEIAEEDQLLLRRWEGFRTAAEYVAAEFAHIPAVGKVVLFGSVALPLYKEVPRFRKFRRAGIEIYHECKDVDLAVWISDLDCLVALQKARSSAVNRLLEEKKIGVAHHQVEVFVMDAGTGRHLGRLCTYRQCPKGKERCLVTGCGEVPFLRQYEDFVFDAKCLEADVSVLLYSR